MVNCLSCPTTTKMLFQLRWQTVRAAMIGGTAIAAVVAGQQSLGGLRALPLVKTIPSAIRMTQLVRGRIADGNGMLKVRCLNAVEVDLLLEPARTPPSRPLLLELRAWPCARRVHAQLRRHLSRWLRHGAPLIRWVQRRRTQVNFRWRTSSWQQPKIASSSVRIQNGGLSAKQAKLPCVSWCERVNDAEGRMREEFNGGLAKLRPKCIADGVNLRHGLKPAAPIVGATIPIVPSGCP